MSLSQLLDIDLARAGINQNRLAERLNTGAASCSMWRKRNKIPAKYHQALVDIFGPDCAIAAFVANPVPVPEKPLPSQLTPIQNAALETFRTALLSGHINDAACLELMAQWI